MQKSRAGVSTSLYAIVAVFALMTSGACSRDTQVYSDPPPTPTPAPVPAGLPGGFLNESVNGGSASIALDGESPTSTAILLQTEPLVNSTGGFNASGVGNRALLGAMSYAGMTLASLNPLTVNAMSTTSGSAFLNVILLTDLACTGNPANYVVLETYGPALAASAISVSGSDYMTFNASNNQPIWQVSGPPLSNPSGVLLHSNSGANTSDLSALLAAYPNACVVNASSGDPELPNSLPTAGILFSLGDSTTVDFNAAFINSITIGPVTTSAAAWAPAGQ